MNHPTRLPLITVSIVDANPVFRNGLAQALARFPGVVVFDKCADARSAAEALADRPPRVVIVGQSLPDAPDWQFIESLRGRRPALQVVAVSDREAVADVHAALRAGAIGYILRSTPVAEFQRVLHDVMLGGAPLSLVVARALVSSFSAPRSDHGLLADLTERESEVLDLLSRGLRYRQIADAMRLSTDTVHSHAKNVYRKLGVGSKTEAAMIWMRSLTEAGGPPKLLSAGA
jgi:NarL family two-component system response regulator LiaR